MAGDTLPQIGAVIVITAPQKRLSRGPRGPWGKSRDHRHPEESLQASWRKSRAGDPKQPGEG